MTLPDWIDKEDWKAFVAMRVKIKKPLSDNSKKRALKVLEGIKDNGQDPNLALQFAEDQCNRGIFPVPMWYYRQMGITMPTREKEYGKF